MKGLKGKLVLATCMICMVSVMDMAGNKMLKGFAVATVISLFTGVAIISIVAGQIVKPVSRLADMVEKREFTREIKINSKDEIGRLAKGFNEMFQSLQRLLEIFADIKDIVGDIRNKVADNAVITKELEMSTNISLENMGKLQDGVQVLEDK